jgi:hypothetical protein
LKDIDAIAAVFYPRNFLPPRFPAYPVAGRRYVLTVLIADYRRAGVEAGASFLIRACNDISSDTGRRTELGRGYTPRIGERRQSFVAALCACKDSAGDVPSDRMLLSPDREYLAGPFKGGFHIGQRPGIEAICNHGRLLGLWHRPASTRRANLNGGNSRQAITDHAAGIALPCVRVAASRSAFHRSSALGEKYPLQVSGIPENARFLHGLGSLRTRRHHARLLQRRQGLGFQIELRPVVFLLFSHQC